MTRPSWLALAPLLLVSSTWSACSSGPTTTMPTARSIALPGGCVDPYADATIRQSEELADSGDVSSEVPGAPDVDGDGSSDRMFTAGAGVISSTLVYVMRGSCGHFVGDIGQPPASVPTAERHHGLLDLRVPDSRMCEGARCGCEAGDMWFRFDGTTYQLDQAASRPGTEVACPDE